MASRANHISRLLAKGTETWDSIGSGTRGNRLKWGPSFVLFILFSLVTVFAQESLTELDYRAQDSLILDKIVEQNFWIHRNPRSIDRWWWVTVENNRVTELMFSKGYILPEETKNLMALKTVQFVDLMREDSLGLAEAFKQLPAIEKITFRGHFSKVIPPEIGCLTSVKKVRISGHSFRDPVTRNAIITICKALPQLTELDISNNNLGKIPPEVFDLTSLQKLDISKTNISELPSRINNLTDLRYFKASNNYIHTIPEEFGALTNLEEVILTKNHLTKLPKSIQNLKKLRRLYLWSNRLVTLPEEISKLSALQELDLSDNNIIYLPGNFDAFASLQKLNLNNNNLTSFPREVIDIKTLKELHLKKNFITHIPQKIKQSDFQLEITEPELRLSKSDYVIRTSLGVGSVNNHQSFRVRTLFSPMRQIDLNDRSTGSYLYAPLCGYHGTFSNQEAEDFRRHLVTVGSQLLFEPGIGIEYSYLLGVSNSEFAHGSRAALRLGYLFFGTEIAGMVMGNSLEFELLFSFGFPLGD